MTEGGYYRKSIKRAARQSRCCFKNGVCPHFSGNKKPGEGPVLVERWRLDERGQRALHLFQRGRFDLADALGGNTELVGQRVQRGAGAVVVGQPAGFHDAARTGVQIALARALGIRVDEVTRGLRAAEPSSLAEGRLLRLRDLPAARPLDLWNEALPPGLPELTGSGLGPALQAGAWK